MEFTSLYIYILVEANQLQQAESLRGKASEYSRKKSLWKRGKGV